jgi:hypothetical protein
MREDWTDHLWEVTRIRPLWLDLLFPFVEVRQFLFLAALSVAGFTFAWLIHTSQPLVPTLMGWMSASIALATVAPGKAVFPVSATAEIMRTLERMRFAQTAQDKSVWRHPMPAWLQWKNSMLVIDALPDAILVKGPLSTLTYLRNDVRRKIAPSNATQ